MKLDSSKIKRKLKEYQRKLIPYNLHYRPTGIYTGKNSDDFEIKTVIPRCTTNLQVPKYLYDRLSPFTIYDQISEEDENTLTVTTDYVVCKIRYGRVYSNNTSIVSVISKDNQLVGDVSFQYKKGFTVGPPESPIFSQKYFPKPTHYKGTVFNMLAGGGAARGNPGHWLLDVIPRLHLLKESGYFKEVDWFLVPQYQKDFQKQTMNFFGIKDEQVIEGGYQTHIHADQIISSTHPRGEKSFLIPKWIVDFYQKNFDLENYSDPSSPKLVYVSRKDSPQRKVLNENELISGLERLGFVSVELSDYDFFAKIKLFRNADFIVSSTGAGLTPLFFCRQNTKLFEFFSKSFTHTHYYNIAKMAGMNYDCLVFDTLNNIKNMQQGITDNIVIDPKLILQKVKKMI